MGNNSVKVSKSEKIYLERIKKYPNQVILATSDAKLGGYDLLYSNDEKKEAIPKRISDIGIPNGLKIAKIMIKAAPSILKTKSKDFKDIEPYLNALEENGEIVSDHNILSTYPNKELWTRLQEYSWETWKVKIGFTKLPRQLIFKGKGVLFPYTLVCIQEMSKEKIDLAPEIEASGEYARVYGTLGEAVNGIARWLRMNYNINCQSNHPHGGLVNTPPIAGKAGMGWQGRNGLLITPEFGQRQRIAPIFIEEKIFEYTDNQNHRWIEEYCKLCGKCKKACPTQAIYDKKIISIEDVPGIGATRTCIDFVKCRPYFNKTMGCAVCIKVCPFSQGIEVYDKLKHFVNNKKQVH